MKKLTTEDVQINKMSLCLLIGSESPLYSDIL